MYSWHEEEHKSQRSGWLRAGVLGANDGLISVASILIGVVAARPSEHTIVLTGVAAVVAGAISMAAGEYVSVSSQADTERADRELEARELQEHPHRELHELTHIYIQRGLARELAEEVAEKLMEHNALEAHMRDEIGLTEISQAKPLQASLASALSFLSGAALPVIVAIAAPRAWKLSLLAFITLLGLAILGVISARIGGASVVKGVARILIWGALSLLISSLIGRLFGVVG